MPGDDGQTTALPPVNSGESGVEKFQKLSLLAKKFPTPAIPARCGFGSVGRKVMIKVNHFSVGIGNIDPHQYDVTFDPVVTSKTKRRDLMKIVNQNSVFRLRSGNIMLLAYDGNKSAFAAGPLPFVSKKFVVHLPQQNGTPEFEVAIKFAAMKTLDHLMKFLAGGQQDNPHETIQALDGALRVLASKDYEIVGRSLVNRDFGTGPLGDGIEYWKGFYQSLRPTQMGLSLIIDMSVGAFYEPKVLTEFVGEFLGTDLSSPLSKQERVKLKRALKGVRVEVRRQDYKRQYKVQGLTDQPICKLKFSDSMGASKTVVQYFREKYNVELRFPDLPAIQAGTDAKPTYLPMEICWITPGQRYALKLNELQVTKFLKATCQRPKDREASIAKTMKHNEYNKDALVNKDFEMNVTEELSSIEARVLPPPQLSYRASRCSGRSSNVNPSVGVWNMSGLEVIDGGTVNYWTVINFSQHTNHAVGHFIYRLIFKCQTRGIAFDPQPVIPMCSAMHCNIEEALANLQTQASKLLSRVAPEHLLQMLFVILPETEGAYPRIKRECETELGIVSQCCKPQHVLNISDQYLENLALKINVKVGGRNTVLSACLNSRLPIVTERPTIIFGASVTHPQPGEGSSPSIAAVVASMDWPQVSKYKALVSAQPHRKEIIQDLYTTRTDPKIGVIYGGLIRELLLSFKKETGRKPHRLIFYRDGVSEGQFSEVLLNEMNKIRKACISLEENYMPPVTFIVVDKRHHTRFFPVRHGDRAGTDGSSNILPGTVVDTKICHPYEFDFYLCSHAGIQGTSRPTRYHVLYDENKFTPDGLQMLTNSLCYTYARCTRSVSIVPPAYYATLAALRARSYMEGDQSDSSSSRQLATGDHHVAKHMHGDHSDSSSSRQLAKRYHVAEDGSLRNILPSLCELRPLPVIHDNVKSVMFYC